MKLLIVDDEIKIIRAIQRELMKFQFDITSETNPLEAKKLISKYQYDIILTDYKMPGITGLELLKYIKAESPQSVPIMMTGYSGLEMLIEAINDKLVFKFIAKPWQSEQLKNYMTEAIQYRTELLDSQFIQGQYFTDSDNLMRISSALKGRLVEEENGLLSAFIRIMQVKDFSLYKHSKNVAKLASGFANYLGLSTIIQENIYNGGLLHDIGKIVIRDQIILKKEILDDIEYKEIKKHPLIGSAIIKEIPSLSPIAKIVEQHHERIDGNGYPSGLVSHQISKEASIVSICDVYDALVSERVYKEKVPSTEAFNIIKSGKAGAFDPGLVLDFNKYIQSIL